MSLILESGCWEGCGILMAPSGGVTQGARTGWFPALLSNPSFKNVS